jgi:hypothetical protein
MEKRDFESRSSVMGVGESSPSKDRLDEFRYLDFDIV